MKVLFLDIDGVVNKQDNFKHSKGTTPYPVDSYCAFLVARIVSATDCQVVLSSSWRNYPDAVKIVSSSIVPLLSSTPNLYYDYDPPIIARGREWNKAIRGDEINKWLDDHHTVKKYAILDDDEDFHDNQPLFQTNFKEGLTDEIARKVIEYLNEESEL